MIGFAAMHFSVKAGTVFNNDNHPDTGLTFLGMTAIMDPPRDDVEQALVECKVRSGSRVDKMKADFFAACRHQRVHGNR